jgi:hypothetical protein
LSRLRRISRFAYECGKALRRDVTGWANLIHDVGRIISRVILQSKTGGVNTGLPGLPGRISIFIFFTIG